jgi:hypothetical protein
LAIASLVFANTKDLSTLGKTQHRASGVTILLHLAGCLTLTTGYMVSAVFF